MGLREVEREVRQRLGLANVTTEPAPQRVGSIVSEPAMIRLSGRRKEPPDPRAAQDAERRVRAERWRFLVGKIGSRYQQCDLADWHYHGDRDEQRRQSAVISIASAYLDELPEKVRNGAGVVMIGPPGTGKDFIMSVLMRAAVLQHGIQVDWTNGVDLFGSIRDAFHGHTTERALIQQWAMPTVLAMSDPLPPRGALTDFEVKMLFRIIDQRYRAKRPTWTTLNVEERGETEKRMGTQVISRLAHDACVMRCEWPDFRWGDE